MLFLIKYLIKWFTNDVSVLCANSRLSNKPGVGVTKASFVNLSIKNVSILQKYLLDYFNYIHIW